MKRALRFRIQWQSLKRTGVVGGTRRYEGWSWNYADPSFTFELKQTHRFVKPMEQLSLQINVFNKTNTSSTVQTNQGVGSSSVLQRVAQGDRTAVKECIDNYGNLIWSLAKKFTDSIEDAEAVTSEIFLNIWRYAARFEKTDLDELLFITLIARRQLRKYSENSIQSIS